MHDKQTERQGIIPSLCNKLLETSKLRQVMDMADTQLTFGEDGAIVYHLAGMADQIAIIHNAWYHYMIHADSMVHKHDMYSLKKFTD